MIMSIEHFLKNAMWIEGHKMAWYRICQHHPFLLYLCTVYFINPLTFFTLAGGYFELRLTSLVLGATECQKN